MRFLLLLSYAALLLTSPMARATPCPAGYFALPTPAEKAVCVEIVARPHVRNFEAAPLCEEKGARLCTGEELRAACESGRAEGAGLGWEWSFSLDQYLSASLNGACDSLAFGELTHHAALRCCR